MLHAFISGAIFVAVIGLAEKQGLRGFGMAALVVGLMTLVYAEFDRPEDTAHAVFTGLGAAAALGLFVVHVRREG